MKMINVLKKKNSSKKGFSLVETLLAVVLVGLLCIIVGGGTVVVKDAFQRMVKKENAVTLCSTIETKLESELRNAEYRGMDGDTILFVSHSNSSYRGMVIGIAQDPFDDPSSPGVIRIHFYSKDGDSWKDMDGESDADKKIKAAPILPESTFSDNLVPELTLNYDDSAGTFSYRILIKDASGDDAAVLAASPEKSDEDGSFREIKPKY